MDYQAQILEFLQKPENLAVALEVAKNIEALRSNLHNAFWKDMYKTLQSRLDKSTFADRWMIFSERNFDEAYKSIEIKVKSLPSSFKGTYLEVCLEQGTPATNYSLYYGLVWALEERSAPDSETFRTLLKISKNLGVSNENQNSWWPMKSFLNTYPRTDEFLLKYSSGLIEDLAERIWNYFTTLEPTLFMLNQELFEGK
jgi:hypothetical protein